VKTSFLVLYDDPGWRLAKVGDRGVELRELAEQGDDAVAAVAKALEDWGYDGAGVVLGLPSSMIYAAQIDCTALPRTQRRLAMLFRLEEKLPLDIERLTAEFLPPASGRTLGVAVETKRLGPILDALTAAGAEPLVACPTALLAL
jgi:type II secretory pathway component PulL